ncbi:MAG: hypothetical protein AAGM38_12920, partial [Pseudomonadota bacterium]
PDPRSPDSADSPTPDQPKEEASPGKDQITSFEAERIYLDADGFRTLFEGKTVHLRRNGEHYGSEYYKTGDRSLWIARDQPCQPGYWYYVSERFCFQYEVGGPYCWSVFRQGEQFYAESFDGFELEIYAVDEQPLSCSPELLS